jgi:hypothetical protein
VSLFSENRFRILSEDGEFTLTYPELLDSEYIGRIRDAEDFGDNVCLILGRTLVVFLKKYLSQRNEKAKLFHGLREMQKRNPLQFFAPSGPGAVGFINDTESKVCFLVSGNRCGKTASAVVKKLVGIIPTDKNWPLFTEHGVKWRPHHPGNIGIGTYEWGNHKKTIGPEVLKWLPMDVCEEYIPVIRGGGGRVPNYDVRPILPLPTCGSEIHFYAYSQDQAPYESEALNGWLWDEQPSEEKWDGANERLRSKRHAQHDFGLTPHRLPDNPYTGAGTFIHRLWKREVCKGYPPDRIRSYKIHMISEEYKGDGHPLGDVPEWVYPEENKIIAFNQHVLEPTERGDIKAIRRGRARLFGDWESSEGMVYEDWDKTVHRIDPFKLPPDACKFRALDHGRRNPTAVLWGAICRPGSVMNYQGRSVKWPDDEAVMIIYREYYKRDTVIGDHARMIIEASGNKRVGVGPMSNRYGSYQVYRESFLNERYSWTIGDPKSMVCPMPDSGMTVGRVYGINGLQVQPAPDQRKETSIDVVREWMKVDYQRDHPFWADEKGFTKLLVFSSCVNFISEIEGYVNVEHPSRRGGVLNLVERPRAKDDHLMDALLYLLLNRPVWRNMQIAGVKGHTGRRIGVDTEDDRRKQKPKPYVDPITKY